MLLGLVNRKGFVQISNRMSCLISSDQENVLLESGGGDFRRKFSATHLIRGFGVSEPKTPPELQAQCDSIVSI